MSYLTVVGAGICGSSLTRAARAARHDVTLVDADTPTDSLAAMAVLRRAWIAKPERPLYDRSLELLTQWETPMVHGAVITSYRGYAPRSDPDWHLVDPAHPLVTPDILGHAKVTEYGLEVACIHMHDPVLWATGAYTKGAAGLTYGVTWIHDDPAAALITPDVLRVHHMAPYKTAVAGQISGKARFGSSSATSAAKAWEAGHAMLEAGVRLGLITGDSGWYPAFGTRCHHAPGTAVGGMHRMGYALAPACAEKYVKTLGDS